MTKLLLTADWHLSDNPRDAYRFGAAELVHQVARRRGVTDLFILGDLTEDRDNHGAAFTNRVVALLTRIAEPSTECPDGIRVIVVRGNHDAADPATPFFRFVNAIPNLIYVTEPEALSLGDIEVAVIPHGAWAKLEAKVDLILTHQTFGGSLAENGSELQGLRLPMHGPPVFSGDVHVPQRQGKVTYVGPPTLIKFGDNFQPRVIVIDDRLHATSVALRTPTKRLVEINAYADGRLEWPDTPLYKGDIVKLKVHFPQAIPPLSHLRAELDVKARELGINLYSVIPVVDRPNIILPTKQLSRDDGDLVRQYAETLSLDPPTTDVGLKIVART